MAKFGRAVWVGVLGALAGAAFPAVPRILIVQALAPVKKEIDPNLPVANVFAQEIDDSGKLSSIVWSMTDPVFRAAVLEGKLKNVPDQPKLGDSLSIGRTLGAEYLLVVGAVREAKSVKGQARLYINGREVWKDQTTMTAETSGNYDADATARSIARTLVLKMTNVALKGLTSQPKIETPEPAKGQLPTTTPTEPVEAPKSNFEQIKTTVASLLKDQNFTAAITMLRDAVDAAPFDVERRTLLIETLMTRDPASAAAEAARAGALFPDKNELRLVAAKAWIRAGKTKEAQEELNQAIVRAPDSPETRMLLAELSLQLGRPEAALPHLDQAIKSSPSAEAFFLRSVCRALLGGADGVRLDLEAMDKAAPEKSPLDVARRYKFAVNTLDGLFSPTTDDIRALVQRVTVKPKDAEVREAIDNVQHNLAARIELLKAIQTPPDEQKRHDRWLLAHQLLAQTMRDLVRYSGGDADALTDARMNLGDALKQVKEIRGQTATPN